MSVRFFNTYSRELEELRPIAADGRTVKMYTCGPTVYSYAHIGNFRAYLFEDLLQRHLELRGFKVERVMNITDVDDKTIRGCQEAGVPLAEFTEPFTRAFFEDLDVLRIKRADTYPRATEQRYVATMISMIETLIARGLAYQAEDKSVYFRIKNFPEYGKLAHFNLDELQSTGRVKNDEYEKESVGDFALWKAWDEADGAVRWDSPWGPGRPGWHIECSAMSTQLLGEQLDIHCGGVDNIFPHHEAEIAQTEGVTGKQFVRYWLHCAHLQVDAQKMSKSLGNFHTLRDVLGKGYTGREARFALMRVHYRAPLNFTWEGMDEARQALGRIDDWVARLRAKAAEENVERRTSNAERRTEEDKNVERSTSNVQRPTEEFEQAFDDDLNISGALGVLFDSIRQTNRALDAATFTPEDAKAWLHWWNRIDTVLALTGEDASVPPNITALVEARAQARLAKEWRKSDELRDELAALGWEVRDTKDGQKITRRGGAS